MQTLNPRRVARGSSIAVLALAGVLGLAGCVVGGGDAEEPAAPETSASESTEPTETESGGTEPTEESDGDAAASGELCTDEQIATISSAGGATLPAGASAAATATFEPAGIVDGLPIVCLFTISEQGIGASFAAISGGSESISATAANATAAGGEVTEAGGAMSGTIDGATIGAVPFTQVTQETAGFDDVEDLVVVVSTTTG